MSSPWTVVVLVLIILGVRLAVGTWKQSDWLWLALLVLIGMIPPLTMVATGIAGIGLLIVLLHHYQALTSSQRGSFYSNAKGLFPK